MPDLSELKKEQKVRVEATSVSNSFKMPGCMGQERDGEAPERDKRSKYGLFTKWEKFVPHLNSNRRKNGIIH